MYIYIYIYIDSAPTKHANSQSIIYSRAVGRVDVIYNPKWSITQSIGIFLTYIRQTRLNAMVAFQKYAQKWNFNDWPFFKFFSAIFASQLWI